RDRRLDGMLVELIELVILTPDGVPLRVEGPIGVNVGGMFDTDDDPHVTKLATFCLDSAKRRRSAPGREHLRCWQAEAQHGATMAGDVQPRSDIRPRGCCPAARCV